MDGIRDYLLSVICCAMLCGIVIAIAGNKSLVSKLIPLVSGVLLSLTILRPIVQPDINNFLRFDKSIYDQAAAAVALGQDATEEEISAIIKKRTEAYILDKAVSMGAELEVEVTVDSAEQWKITEVYLRGNISPYAKAKLSAYITDELAISLEDQKWAQ